MKIVELKKNEVYNEKGNFKSNVRKEFKDKVSAKVIGLVEEGFGAKLVKMNDGYGLQIATVIDGEPIYAVVEVKITDKVRGKKTRASKTTKEDVPTLDL